MSSPPLNCQERQLCQEIVSKLAGMCQELGTKVLVYWSANTSLAPADVLLWLASHEEVSSQ